MSFSLFIITRCDIVNGIFEDGHWTILLIRRMNVQLLFRFKIATLQSPIKDIIKEQFYFHHFHIITSDHLLSTSDFNIHHPPSHNNMIMASHWDPLEVINRITEEYSHFTFFGIKCYDNSISKKTRIQYFYN